MRSKLIVSRRTLSILGICTFSAGYLRAVSSLRRDKCSTSIHGLVFSWLVDDVLFLFIFALIKFCLCVGIHVQTTGRNSTEDAQTALKLYRKYRELNDDPTVNFTAAVQRLYKAGRQNDWVVPA